jgi:hypothetical protein
LKWHKNKTCQRLRCTAKFEQRDREGHRKELCVHIGDVSLNHNQTINPHVNQQVHTFTNTSVEPFLFNVSTIQMSNQIHE